MARPDLTDLRQRQILDAFVSCVAEYGLQGSTQQRIAERAGVKRPILRHYLGNKEEMVEALVDHVVTRYDEQLHWLSEALPAEGRVEELLQLLFLTESGDYELGITYQALLVHCAGNAKLHSLRQGTERFFELVSRELRQQFPSAPQTRIELVTLTLVSLSIAQESLAPLGDAANWARQAHRAAMAQLDLLKGDHYD